MLRRVCSSKEVANNIPELSFLLIAPVAVFQYGNLNQDGMKNSDWFSEQSTFYDIDRWNASFKLVLVTRLSWQYWVLQKKVDC